MLYLDNSATTKIDPQVLDAMRPYLEEEYGNPSSKYYSLAENARKAVQIARVQVAQLLGCESDEVIFTSGSTESNNMIIKGVADYYGAKNKHIITSQVEHPSVIESCKYLETKGFIVSYLDVDKFGRTSLSDLMNSAKDKDNLLVSIIWGNNEIGSINPIEEISDACLQQDIPLHTDATQVIGKMKIDLRKLPGIRFLSLSAHKINGPKGVGACIVKKESSTIYTKMTPLLHGGGQENNYRSGTLAVHNIVGLGMAAKLAHERLDQTISKLQKLEIYLKAILTEKMGDQITFNSDVEKKIPGLLNLQFKGINNELLIKKLSNYMALSTGSACSSSKPSHVLSAIGLDLNEIRQTIRITLSPEINSSELDLFKTL
jgi:cysteine desulfurase